MNLQYIHRFFKTKAGFFYFIILTSAVSFMLGSLLGALLINTLDDKNYNKISFLLNEYVSNMSDLSKCNISSRDIFIGSVLKYGKAVLFIWVMGFFSFGFVFIFATLFLKGMSIGFTSALISRQFGIDGILYTIALYIPQNIILIPVYFMTAFFSIRFMCINRENKKMKRDFSTLTLKEFITVLFLALILILVAGLIDIYITPLLFVNNL